MEHLAERFADLGAWQIALGAMGLLLQGCVLPSVPEEIVLATLGTLVAQGRIPAPLALGAALAGLLPANSATAFLGSLGRRRLARGGFLARPLASPRLAAAIASFRRHGPALVLVTRFVPLVRGPIYLAAGLSGLGVPRFLALDAAAALVQVPLLLWIGSRLGQGASPAEAWARIAWFSAALLACFAVVVTAHRLLATARGPRAP